MLLQLDAAEDGSLRMQDLGLRAVLSRSRVSRIVSELETAGLGERCPDPDDGRATLAAITPQGRQQLRATAPIMSTTQRDLAPAPAKVGAPDGNP